MKLMIFLLAWRNIWRNKMRSIVIMLSIALGLFAGIAVLALYKGMMKSRVRTVIDAETGHIQIHNTHLKMDFDPKYIIGGKDNLLVSIRNIPEVKLAAPRTITQGMLATATGSSGVQINGVIPELEYEASLLKRKIVEGTVFDEARKNEIMIGKKLARKMKLRRGSKLVLTFTDTSATIVSAAFKVAAIYQSDNAPLDERNVYVNLSDLSTLLNLGKEYHEIVVLLKNDESVMAVQQRLKKEFPTY